jgi:pimeloyl-ACP methyl ester carboxylesterase
VTAVGAGTLPVLPDGDLALPAGDELVVTTDDGAALAVTVALPPAGAPGAEGDAAGDLPTVVLPHCWTGARAVWVPVARRLLAAGHPVVLYDQRGHGASGTGRDRITVGRLGDDLAAVLDHLDLRDVVLAGHSMGGMTVMAFACGHPDSASDRVRSLALVATAAHGLAARGRARFWRIVLWRDLVDRAMARPVLGRACVRGVFGADPRRAHVEAMRRLFVETPADVRRACVEAMGEMDLRTALAAVDVPAVVVLGRRDTLIVNRLTRAIVDHVRGATLVELPGAGHMLPFERPDEVVAAVRRVAAGVTPSA